MVEGGKREYVFENKVHNKDNSPPSPCPQTTELLDRLVEVTKANQNPATAGFFLSNSDREGPVRNKY